MTSIYIAVKIIRNSLKTEPHAIVTMPTRNHKRHVMRKFQSEKEMKEHEQEVQKRHRENTPRFSWPNTIIWKGQEVTVNMKTPNFAMYMLGASQMNRKLYLSKDEYLRWLKQQEQ